MKARALLGVLTFAATATAHAQGARFGAANQVVLSTDATTSVSYFSSFGADARTFGISLSPSVDFFVVRNVSIGAGLDGFYDWSHASGNEATSLGVGVRGRVGVNVPLGRWISWWPEAQIAFDAAGASGEAISGPTISLFAPLLLVLRTHFFIGFGPYVAHTFDDIQPPTAPPFSEQSTEVALQTVLGGTVGGDAESDDARAPVRWKPFGERGELAIGGSASVDWYGDQTFGFWTVSTSASAGFGYFVARHLSLGLEASGGYTRSQTNTTPTESWHAAIRPEIGWDLPIGERFSIYPRASLGIGVTQTTQPAGSTRFDLDVGAYVPVLYHFAPHVFAGFGPTFDVVVLDAASPSAQTDNRSASVGAALSLGGWL